MEGWRHFHPVLGVRIHPDFAIRSLLRLREPYEHGCPTWHLFPWSLGGLVSEETLQTRYTSLLRRDRKIPLRMSWPPDTVCN